MLKLSKYAVLSVMGPHAGEDSPTIFARKMADIRSIGKTFWLVHSHMAKPEMTQKLCLTSIQQACSPHCFFLEPSTSGGAVPTKSSCAASEYSDDFTIWHTLPAGLTPVTGKITPSACALVFDELTIQKSEIIDLWDYADFFNHQRPVTIRQGASTVCVIGEDTRNHPNKIKSHLRQVIAVGRLVKPYAVWLR
jgi:hypothetical protein